jgi:membrane protein implicated in regulation of membrane protease activity
VVELLTGTFYLLLLAAGFAAAAIAAHLGLGTVTQLIVAAVIGVGAVLVWYSIQRKRPAGSGRRHQPRREPRHAGESVHVDAWNGRRHRHRALPRRPMDGGAARGARPPPASTAWSR